MKLTAEAVFFHCVTVLLCVLCRIMHWARRIEQEIDRVLQHISGAQQLKGVRLCVCVWLFQYLCQMCAHYRGSGLHVKHPQTMKNSGTPAESVLENIMILPFLHREATASEFILKLCVCVCSHHWERTDGSPLIHLPRMPQCCRQSASLLMMINTDI